MNKKIHNHRKDKIVKNHTYRIGRLTVVKLVTKSGNEAVGWTRRLPGDKDNPEFAEGVAKGRAEKALTLSQSQRRYCRYMA